MRERRSAGLIEAATDRKLLGVLDLWPKQEELLRLVEAGPRIIVVAAGRRSAKTTTAAIVALWDALLRPDLDRLVRPGERRYAVCIANNVAQARLFVHAARSIVERSPLLSRLVRNVTDDAIEFDRTTVAAFPCTSRGARGWPISTLLLDEFAHHVDGEGLSAAESVWRSLVPSCAQFGQAARVIVASTPLGADGLFADLYARADAGELDGAAAFHATSAEANPTLDADFLRSEFERDPDSFAAEYEARFVGSGGAFLDPDRIAASVAGRDELHRLDAHEWIAGLDPGFHHDPFGLTIVGRDPHRPELLRLAFAREWRPVRGGSFDERRRIEDATLAEAVEFCRHYEVSRAVCDQFLAPAVVDYFARRGVHVEPIPMTATSKTLAYQELRERLNLGQLELYDHPDLLAQLRRLRTRYKAGSASVVNPRVAGSHGDLAQALALAVHAMRESGNAALRAFSGYEPSPRDGSLDDLIRDTGGLDYGMRL